MTELLYLLVPVSCPEKAVSLAKDEEWEAGREQLWLSMVKAKVLLSLSAMEFCPEMAVA